MAEKQKTQEKLQKTEKSDKTQKTDKVEKKKPYFEEKEPETLVRIMGCDIPGSKNIYSGLTRIKGISWAISNAVCLKLNFPRTKKITALNKEEIVKIEKFLKELPLPDFLKNRRKDIENGETKHYFGSDLDIKREFDIKRLKEIKSYRGIRHAAKLPVRGQRTRSHFRKKGIAMGVKRKKA
ncbi:MAG: 30S ribosomal protein S13 [Nanoarchaeota archaeon]